jgi:hypothetical protein
MGKSSPTDFDLQVAALRGKVEPRRFFGKKADATPEQWAAEKEYARASMVRRRDEVSAKRRAEYAAMKADRGEKLRRFRESRKRAYEASRETACRRAGEYYRKQMMVNPERLREQRRGAEERRKLRDPERYRAKQRVVRQRSYEKNKHKYRERQREWYEANKEDQRRKMRERHRTIRPQLREYSRARYATNPQHKISESCRNRLRPFLAGRKSEPTRQLVGLDWKDLVAYLQSKLLPGMTWDDVMTGRVHIDHIYPLARADMQDEPQRRAACNWRNLQLLWASDNASKNDTVTPEAKALFDSLVAEFRPSPPRAARPASPGTVRASASPATPGLPSSRARA